jgi:hypothetical protein
MGDSYRSPSAGFSLPSVFALLLSAIACSDPAPIVTELTVTPYVLPDCPPPETNVTLSALGPFSPSNLTVENLPLYGSTRDLRFPANTAAIEAVVSDGARRFLGYSDRRREAGFSLSLFPERRECRLVAAEQDAFPGHNTAKAFGFSPASGTLLVAGGSLEDELLQGALAFDLDRATVQRIPDPGAEFCSTCGLHTPRAHATVTEFGPKLLVAGGEVPPEPGLDVDPGSRAEVFDPALGQFEPEGIALLRGRSRHAAVVLRDGTTLLVGGTGEDGLVSQFELVSPESRRATLLGLAELRFGREHPQALVLSDGRVFVGGGVDEQGAPIASAEWFSADATDPEFETALEPKARDWSFAPLAGGGVLGVAGCEPEREPDEPCTGVGCPTNCTANCCLARCPDGGCPSDKAVWFGPDGVPTAITAPARFAAPMLAPGSDGSPWLFDAALPSAPLFRFNPWRAEFERTTATIHSPPARDAPIVSLGPDAFAWLTASEPPELIGFRAGTRSVFSSDLPLVTLVDPEDPARPWHLAPDRAVPPDMFRRSETSMQNELALGAPDAEPRVWLTDALFGDVSVSIDYTGAPPILLLGETRVGSESCPWPDPELRGGALRVVRAGASLRLDQSKRTALCDGPSGSVAIGLAAADATSNVSRLEVARN